MCEKDVKSDGHVSGAEAVCMGEVIPGEDPGYTQQWTGGAEEGGLPQRL